MGDKKFLDLTKELKTGNYSLYEISIFKKYYKNKDDKCEVVFLNRQTKKYLKVTYRDEAKFWGDIEVLLVICYLSYLKSKNVHLYHLARYTRYFNAKEIVKINSLFRTVKIDEEGNQLRYLLINTKSIKKVIAELITAKQIEQKQISVAKGQQELEDKKRLKQYYAQAVIEKSKIIRKELENDHKLRQELLGLCSPDEPLYKMIQEIQKEEANNIKQELVATYEYQTSENIDQNLETPAVGKYKEIMGLLAVFRKSALSSIKTKHYGIPDNCRIDIEPKILSTYFSYAIIKESKGEYIALVKSSDREFILKLTEQINNQMITILEIYLLCVVADIVKARNTVNQKAGIQRSEHSSSVKRHKTVRRYPRGKGLYGRNKESQKGYDHQPSFVPWHFRYIGRSATHSAQINAMMYAGIESIPAGFTFVRPYWRGINPGSKIPDIEIQSQLAQSFTKSIDLLEE